jgi:ribonuclease VapC
MVIDSSAVIAILRNEPEGLIFKHTIVHADVRLMSAMTKLECGMVAIGLHEIAGATELDRLLAELMVTIVPFDDHQAYLARDAFARYGKGRHRAALNFGDCAAYALSIAEAEPLLFKGTDFGATDVEIVNLA